ncbi:type-F conjugative transfer system protein TrbI [Erwinia typographi]|uniref:type-F conjugative transfer system protein TrbI n=1 Tax=Erwinia typographi TaxID=371042 RepID=UPI00068E0940|nr:type-F conjugative transfer system protein TrbI [Erwinia typographi]
MKTLSPLVTILLSVLISLVCCCAAWFYLLRPPVLVTFDMKGTVNAFIRQSAKLELDDAQRRQLLTRFDRNMNAVTLEYAQQHHASILVSAAAVRGVPDVTADIRTRLASAMQEKTAPAAKAP